MALRVKESASRPQRPNFVFGILLYVFIFLLVKATAATSAGNNDTVSSTDDGLSLKEAYTDLATTAASTSEIQRLTTIKISEITGATQTPILISTTTVSSPSRPLALETSENNEPVPRTTDHVLVDVLHSSTLHESASSPVHPVSDKNEGDQTSNEMITNSIIAQPSVVNNTVDGNQVSKPVFSSSSSSPNEASTTIPSSQSNSHTSTADTVPQINKLSTSISTSSSETEDVIANYVTNVSGKKQTSFLTPSNNIPLPITNFPTDDATSVTDEKMQFPFVTDASPEYTDNELPVNIDSLLFRSSSNRAPQYTTELRSYFKERQSDAATNAVQPLTEFEDTDVSSTELTPEIEDETTSASFIITPAATELETLTSSSIAFFTTPSAVVEHKIEVEIMSSTVGPSDEENLSNDQWQMTSVSDPSSSMETTVAVRRETTKHYEFLTPTESTNAVTVMFLAPTDVKTVVYWDNYRNQQFRRFVTDAINQFFQENEMKKDEEDMNDFRVLPDDVVYVNPSPVAEDRTIYVVFFVRNQSIAKDNVVDGDAVLTSLRRKVALLQEEMGLNVTIITKGIILVKVNEPFFVRHAVVFISLLAVALFCILIIIIALIYIRCKNSHGKWERNEYAETHKLKKDMKQTPEMGDDLRSAQEIQSDELGMAEKGSRGQPYLNGNGMHPVVLDDDGWVIPFEEVLNQSSQRISQRPYNEDTKL